MKNIIKNKTLHYISKKKKNNKTENIYKLFRIINNFP